MRAAQDASIEAAEVTFTTQGFQENLEGALDDDIVEQGQLPSHWPLCVCCSAASLIVASRPH